MTISRVAHILMAEDSTPDVILFKEALRSAAIEAELKVFSDGEECANHFKTTEEPPPDVIIIDLNLPKLSGFDLIRIVRGDRRYDGVPIAVLTSSNEAADRNRSAVLGANTFITKPSGLDDFLDTVGSAIRVILGHTDYPGRLHLTCCRDPKPPSSTRRQPYYRECWRTKCALPPLPLVRGRRIRMRGSLRASPAIKIPRHNAAKA